MPGTAMTRRSFWVLCSLSAALTVLASSTAYAAAFDPKVVVKRDGKTIKNEPVVYGTVNDCEENVEFTFEVDQYGGIASVVEAWLGVGEDCTQEGSRKRSTNNPFPACKLLGSDTRGTNHPIIKVKALDLFTKNWTDNPKQCDPVRATQQTPWVVHLLPLDTASSFANGSTGTVTNTSTIMPLKASFVPYTVRPEAPTGLEASSGESEIGVSFDKLDGQPARTEYRAYFDIGTGGGEGSDEDGSPADCGSGLLVPKKAPPSTRANNIVTKDTSGSSARISGLDGLGIQVGEQVATTAVTIDPAGNASLISEVICVERIQTDGFWDQCERDPDCRNDFESCSVSGFGPARFSYLAWALVLAVLALVTRRSGRNV